MDVERRRSGCASAAWCSTSRGPRKGLEGLPDLGLHQELDVGRDLAQRAGHQSEEAADLGDAVAHGVPGDLRLPETELLHQRRLHLEPRRAEGGEVAGGAAELADEDARAQLVETFAVRSMAASSTATL